MTKVYLTLAVLTFSSFRMVVVLMFPVLLFRLLSVLVGVLIIATVLMLSLVLFIFVMVGVFVLRWLFRTDFLLKFCYTLLLGGVPQRGPEDTRQAYGLQSLRTTKRGLPRPRTPAATASDVQAPRPRPHLLAAGLRVVR